MELNCDTNKLEEYGLETKTILNEYYSVHFFLDSKGPSYLFRLRNNTSSKPYILVRQDSSVFNELKVGDILDMEYNKSESSGGSKLLKTIITSKTPHDRYTGHSIIELSIINN
jgi:hypothetical protein